MWKTTAQTTLLALSLVTFGTGCDLADLIGPIVGQPPTIEPMPEPDPIPPVDDCDLQLEQCLDDAWLGDDDSPADIAWDPAVQDCYDTYAVCIDDVPVPPMPPMPPEICEIELDDCLAAVYGNGQDPSVTTDALFPYDPTAEAACFDAYDDCTGEPPPPPYGVCEIELDDCLMAIYGDGQDPAIYPYDPTAEAACFDAYDVCVGIQPPPPPYDVCEIELDDCLMTIYGGDPTMPVTHDGLFPYDPAAEAACFDAYDDCVGIQPPPPPVDSCTQLFDDCLANGVSEPLCAQVLDECVLNQEPPCDLPLPEPGYPGDDDGDDDVDILPHPMP